MVGALLVMTIRQVLSSSLTSSQGLGDMLADGKQPGAGPLLAASDQPGRGPLLDVGDQPGVGPCSLSATSRWARALLTVTELELTSLSASWSSLVTVSLSPCLLHWSSLG